VSNFAGLPEVVGPGGLVVDSADAGAVADLVTRLADDPAFRAGVADRGRAQSRIHSWPNCVTRVLRALEQAK
jgi:glycosyltransferase involved in cell wall biosynthesis